MGCVLRGGFQLHRQHSFNLCVTQVVVLFPSLPQALASLSGTFVILGGTGNVNVTISGLFTTLQSAMTDQFGLLAQSDGNGEDNGQGTPPCSAATAKVKTGPERAELRGS